MDINRQNLKTRLASLLSIFLLTFLSQSAFALFSESMSATYPGNENPRIWTTTLFGNLAANQTETGTWEIFVEGGVTGGTSAYNESQDVERVFFVKDKKVSTFTINRGTPSNIVSLPGGNNSRSFEHAYVKARAFGDRIIVMAVSRDGRLCRWLSNSSKVFTNPFCTSANMYSLTSSIEAYANLTRVNGRSLIVPHFLVRSADNKRIYIWSLVDGSWQTRNFSNGDRVITSMTLGSSDDGSTWLATRANNRIWMTSLRWDAPKQLFNLLPPLPEGTPGSSMVIRSSKYYFLSRPPLNQVTCAVFLTVNSGGSIWTWSKSRSVYTQGSTCSPISTSTTDTYWTEVKHPDNPKDGAVKTYFYPGISAGRQGFFMTPPPLYGVASSGLFTRKLNKNFGNQFEEMGSVW